MSMDWDRQLIDEATDWLVLISSGGASEHELMAYRLWRQKDPAHERICVNLEQQLRLFKMPATNGLGSRKIRKVLEAPSSRRQFLAGSLCIGGSAAGAVWLANGGQLGIGGDLQTGLAERRAVTLDDGSRLIMNAETSIDIHFTEHQRRLHLRRGELLTQVAHAPERPFVVTTPCGRVEALGAELLVRHLTRSRVVALSAPVSVRNQAGHGTHLLSHQEMWFERARFGNIETRGEDASAWVAGNLEVRNRSLGEVVETMRSYRRGFLRVSKRAASLRVSGRFRLDDSDQMLDALSRVLPIRLNSVSSYWVSIDLA
jgi:transmembrane sensor